MTREVLEKAIELKKQIDALQCAKNEFKEARGFCWGNTGDVAERTFYIEIREDASKIARTTVSPQSIKMALDEEIKNVTEELKLLETEFDKLH